MGERVKEGVLKKRLTQYQSYSMVLKRKLSRACAFIVSTDLCDELATVDHFAVTSLFVGGLST